MAEANNVEAFLSRKIGNMEKKEIHRHGRFSV